MTMNRKIPLFILIFFVLISCVYADGTCSLNKNNYIPGELSTFSCGCTSPQEENRAGYIVYIHDNGTVIQSAATNSGSCRTSAFGDDYIFPASLSNYNGSTIFSLNADGTGSPTNWGDVTDTTEDVWVVNGSSGSECIIEFEVPDNVTPVFDLGRYASLSVEVEDGNSFEKIIGARCTLHVETIQDVHVFSTPNNPPMNYLYTTAGGEAAFQERLDYDILEPNQTYLVRVYCWCPPNGTDNECYFEGNGMAGVQTGFKSCRSTLLADSGEDFRYVNRDNSYLTIAMIIIAVIVLLFILSTQVDIFTYITGEGSEIPVGKFFIWIICLWLLTPVVNIAIVSNAVSNLLLDNTLIGVYRALMFFNIFISTVWLLFIMYWILKKIHEMGFVNKNG